MGNEYNRFNNHHHHYHNQHQHNLHRSTFLPMLCSKPSIKEVRIPKSGVFKEDPVSPRISCMGQVKRGNKVNGFPTSHRLTITTTNSSTNSPTTNHHHNNHNFKYSKLKKLFSAKNLTATTTTTISTTTTTTSSTTTTTSTTRCRRSGPRINVHHCVGTDINLVDLDPPLPVIKREAQEEDQVESLWKRRSGGAALQGLQLKLTPHPRHQNQPTTV